MSYLVDRQRVLYTADLVAVVGVRQRKIRSRVIMKDNSLYHTLTRLQTLVRHSREPLGVRARRRRTI